MRRWIRWGAGLWLAAAAGSSTMASAKPASQAQVRQLMEVAGVNRMLGQMASQINAQLAGMMRDQLPCVPASYWNGFLAAGGFREVTDAVVPIYQKHFSAADIEGLIKFYRSPLGRKMVAQMPAVMSESMQAGQEWGRNRAQAMLSELQKSGRIDAQGRCPAVPSATPGLGSPAAASTAGH